MICIVYKTLRITDATRYIYIYIRKTFELTFDASQTVLQYDSDQFPELCALARILFYVTPVRIRVFMRTLESNIVL